MLQKYTILTRLQGQIIAVIRGKSGQEAIETAEACIRGGITCIEITFTTPDALEAIKQLSRQYNEGEAVIGAGTVLDAETARMAIMSGAEYVVSPHFDGEISRICNRYSIPYLPGCSSVTDIVEALASGVDVVKAFPGGNLGPSFIKSVKGPLPHANLMPSGGVSYDNILDWFEAGSFAVGVGSELTKGIQKGEYLLIEKRAKEYADKVKQAGAASTI
ncbi:bifunctional 2-keto-4-hydroxyglutarate aldolase/2-keto-3-deoxy-6-phosphogluconate aldolase [Metabacillus sp. GX 13764]|uniref:bifunctional 2-keto-4-hydroxyglutarate aldolase/2-keto-3-deoxy-6-phosphogluconate aldolase n=1 Tax=Metabacillus kandeliae TaxID=2900151 RepID=UPI001E4F805F|nr:bifunctional 2-keto-4-hydroxyglutarate aldolase/2-keto-3-deoxy-6-phosphogluconate aldolase [Metabacillus kandeliae]MCD7035977.1 bifunctional 2-keto-4-hydroxyglutarate aldolase/2-keto-3-deoxy-6-phosphogluconate aldolase [Metabacillus kandeliae]